MQNCERKRSPRDPDRYETMVEHENVDDATLGVKKLAGGWKADGAKLDLVTVDP